MRTVIVGAGVSGCFLARKLNGETLLFDESDRPGCHCGWGIPYSHVREMVCEIGIDLDSCVLCRATGFINNGIYVPLGNLATVDKPKLIARLREGLDVTRERRGLDFDDADLVVNATGVPTGRAVFRARAVQERVAVAGAEERTAYDFIHPNHVGYAWLFPLDEEGKIVHLGAACLDTDPEKLVRGLLSYYTIAKKSVICRCDSTLSLADPMGVDILKDHSVAVGAATGCVHPLTGEGIYPSLQTASLLAETIRRGASLEDYASSVRRLLQKYQLSYLVFLRMLSSPFWGWFRAINPMINDMRHFQPQPSLGYKTRLSLNTVSISFRYPQL